MNTTLETFNSKIKERKQRNRAVSESKRETEKQRDEERKSLFKRLVNYLKPFNGKILEGNKIKLEINNRNNTIKFFINGKEYVQFVSCVRPYICDCQDYCNCPPKDVHEMYYFSKELGHNNINFWDEDTFSDSIISLMDEYNEDN